MSLQDTDIKQQLETLVSTWGRLSLSVLGDCNCSAATTSPVTTFHPCPDSSDPVTAGSSAATPSLPNSPAPTAASPITHVPSKKAKARAKAKARNRSKHDAAHELPSVEDIQDQLKKSATSRDWAMLSSSLPPSSPQPISEGTRRGGEGQSSTGTGAGWSDPVAALRCIHGIVAPLVLRDSVHLEHLHELKTALSLTPRRAGTDAGAVDVDDSNSEGDGCPTRAALAITSSVVCVVGGDKGNQDELQVSLLMTYCFLCAALMHHLKAVGGIKHRTHEQEGGVGDR